MSLRSLQLGSFFSFIVLSYVRVFINETCLFWYCWHFSGILARMWLFFPIVLQAATLDSSLSEFPTFFFLHYR